MTTLKQATQNRDTSNLTLLTDSANGKRPPLPAPPTQNPDGGFDSLSLGATPTVLSSETDQLRQWYRNGVSQLRISPLPAAAAPSGGALAQSVAEPAFIVSNSAQATANEAIQQSATAQSTAEDAQTGVDTINGSSVIFLSGSVFAQGLIADATGSPQSVSLDNLNDGSLFARSALEMSNENMVMNPIAAAGTAGWSATSGVVSLTSVTLPTGETGNAFLSPSFANFFAVYSNPFSLTPGETYVYSGYFRTGGTGAWDLYFGNYSDGQISSMGAPTSWTAFAVSYTVPTSGSKSNELKGQLIFANGSVTNDTVEFWGCSVVKARDLEEEVLDGTSRFAVTSAGTSYVPTTNPLTATTSGGGSSTIAIAGFDLRIRNSTISSDIVYSAANITGLSPSTLYYVYVQDFSFAGGTVTFLATTTKATTLGTSGDLYIGSIQTPPTGGPQTVGNGDGGGGSQNGGTVTVWPGTATGLSNNPNGINNYAVPGTPASSGTPGAAYAVSGFSGLLQPACQGISLLVDWASGWTDGATISVSNPSESHVESASFTRKTTIIPLGVNMNPALTSVTITAGSVGSSTLEVFGVYILENF